MLLCFRFTIRLHSSFSTYKKAGDMLQPQQFNNLWILILVCSTCHLNSLFQNRHQIDAKLLICNLENLLNIINI